MVWAASSSDSKTPPVSNRRYNPKGTAVRRRYSGLRCVAYPFMLCCSLHTRIAFQLDNDQRHTVIIFTDCLRVSGVLPWPDHSLIQYAWSLMKRYLRPYQDFVGVT